MRSVIAMLILVAFLAGCSSTRTVRDVRFSSTGPNQDVAAESSPETKPIRVAAASIISPQETIRHYGTFFAYLEQKVGRPIELLQRKTYEETYDLLRYGTLDMAMVCTFVYVKGQAEIGLEVLAAPEVNGKAEYQSFIITRTDRNLKDFSDLAGKRFAFTDPLSASGRIYPLSVLKEQGADPGTFFASTTYTYSHDNSIKAVVQGVVDAAAVDSLVFDQWVKLNPDLGLALTVIDRSPAMGSPPIVVGPRVDPELKAAFRTALMQMHQDPEGQQILKALGIDRFVPKQDADYNTVRDLATKAGYLP